MMEPTNRAGLHWQSLAATERELLFDRVDAFVAGHARTLRLRAFLAAALPNEPARRAGACPDCGHRLGHQYRRGRGAVFCCRRCGWEESSR